MSAPATQSRARRWGPATSHLVRRLALSTTPPSQVVLARDLHVSQPRISQILHLLAMNGIAIEDLDHEDQQRRLVDLYLHHHRPFVQTESLFYGLDPVYEQVRRVIRTAKAQNARIAVSADLAPDLVAPWRKPTLTVIYADRPLRFEPRQFVPAKTRGEATIIVRQVIDNSLLEDRSIQSDVPLVHPLQQLWDLHDLGGEDRIEAAEHLFTVIRKSDFETP
jgi:hypothetical protein